MSFRNLPAGLFFSFSIILLTVFVNAQDSGFEGTPIKDSGEATVRGKAVYEDTGRPVRYGIVGLRSIAGGESSHFVRTDGDGNFEIREVPEGKFNPVFKVEGIISPTTLYDYPLFVGADPPVVEFQTIEILGPGEYRFDLRAKRGATLSGTVRYADGEVAVGLKVKAILLAGPRSGQLPVKFAGDQEATTDGTGFYRISELLPGDYIVQVAEAMPHKYEPIKDYSLRNDKSVGSSEFLNTYAPDTFSPLEAYSVNLGPGAQKNGIDVTIRQRPMYGISGIVIDKHTGQPLTDVDIRFELITDKHEFVLGDPRPKELIARMDFDFPDERSDTDDQGRWKLSGLPKGKYRLTFKQERNPYSRKKVDEAMSGFLELTSEVSIDSSDVSDLVIEMEKGGVISGSVVTDDGSDLPARLLVTIGDYDQEGSWQTASFIQSAPGMDLDRSSKSFRVEKLSKGNFTIEAHSEEHYLKSLKLDGREVTDRSIPLDTGEVVDGLELILGTDAGVARGRIGGFQLDEELRSQGVMFIDESAPGRILHKVFFSDASEDGSFQRSLPPGTYRYVYWMYEFDTGDNRSLEERIAEAMSDAPTITVKPRETVNVNVEFKK